MHRRARRHKVTTQMEIEDRMKDREYARTGSHGPGAVRARRLRKKLRYCLEQYSIYGRRPWEDMLH